MKNLKDIFQRIEKVESLNNFKYRFIEWTCPICGRKFKQFYGSISGMLLHISKTAKNEVVAKQLGEIKKTPHFNFWKKNTQPVENLYKRREWKII